MQETVPTDARKEAKCIQCYVSGRVQGVWYRGSTQQQARALNITGHARNLVDGRVEVLACGELAALETLQGWLLQGPEYADVSNVCCSSVQLEKIPPAFTTA